MSANFGGPLVDQSGVMVGYADSGCHLCVRRQDYVDGVIIRCQSAAVPLMAVGRTAEEHGSYYGVTTEAGKV